MYPQTSAFENFQNRIEKTREGRKRSQSPEQQTDVNPKNDPNLFTLYIRISPIQDEVIAIQYSKKKFKISK